MSSGRSALVAETIRTSILMLFVAPRRVISRSWIARRSFGCKFIGISPISSRNSVPPSASSNCPFFIAEASVNAPFSKPKSSLSIKFSGIAAMFIAINGPSLRGEFLWINLAKSSLPTPLSPISITEASVFATRLLKFRAYSSAGELAAKSLESTLELVRSSVKFT